VTRTTLFSFGYWGSGSATRALVDAVNDAEAQRGFDPPLWVDIRISRAVRAAGFRDNAFEKLLGRRYLHMQSLGNSALHSGRARIAIRDPGAAEELLDHALSNPSRRVIFFCSCELPAGCHRHVVAKLLTKAAHRRKADVTVIEWPGGDPTTQSFEVPLPVFRALARETQKTLALPPHMSPATAASLPWATTAVVTANDASDVTAAARRDAARRDAVGSVRVLLGPAQFSARGAHLKVLAVNPRAKDAAAFRKKNGYADVTASTMR
jgi:hypothetical protein